MTDVPCEIRACSTPAIRRIGNARGEGLRVCLVHLTELRSSLVAPIVTTLDNTDCSGSA